MPRLPDELAQLKAILVGNEGRGLGDLLVQDGWAIR
jgi:hypothetical protein